MKISRQDPEPQPERDILIQLTAIEARRLNKEMWEVFNAVVEEYPALMDLSNCLDDLGLQPYMEGG